MAILMMVMMGVKITVQYADAAVFKKYPEDVNVDYDAGDEHFNKSLYRRGTVLGMSCDAYSEVDNEVS